jgi:hypothetical protein
MHMRHEIDGCQGLGVRSCLPTPVSPREVPTSGPRAPAGAPAGRRAHEQKMYQLIRQPAPIEDRLFEIEFLEPAAAAFAFTLG